MNIFLITTWLGYVNSVLNPIIYTIFNTEYRKAIKKIFGLDGQCQKPRQASENVRAESVRV